MNRLISNEMDCSTLNLSYMLLLKEFTWLVLGKELFMKLYVVVWTTFHHFYKKVVC